jgi:uncharacterized protein (TIGR00162 family)
MDEFERETVTEGDLSDPVLVEGLPGVGHVGKLAAEHVLEELESEAAERVYSTHFPPQVSVEEGCTELAHAEFHAVTPGEGRDLLVLTGNHQAQNNAGHYGLTDAFLDVAADYGAEEVYALGGVPTGELIKEYGVVGAVTDERRVDDLETAGVEFRDEEPAGGIVGVSGLLLGLGERRNFEATCLMGETSGYLVDPKSAQAVLEVLQAVLGIDLDFAELEERAEEMEQVVRKIREMEQGTPTPSDEDLRYIG